MFRLWENYYINKMIDRELLAHAVGVIKNSNTITGLELSVELDIDIDYAWEIIDALIDCGFVHEFEGFCARTDLAGFN